MLSTPFFRWWDEKLTGMDRLASTTRGAKDTVFDELPGAPWLGPMFSSTRSAKATAFEVTELSRSVKIEAPELVEAYWDD